jgi:hypothetical protein
MSTEVTLDVESFLASIQDACKSLIENGYRPDSLALATRFWNGVAGDLTRWSIKHLFYRPSGQAVLASLLSLSVSIVDFLPQMTMIVSDSKGMGDEAMRVLRWWMIAKVEQ